MPEPGHILVVCTGNICRSPMAEGLLRHALAAQPAPLQSLKVVSAGVATRLGEPVSENSVIALKKAGIDISGHRSQPLTQKMLDHALAVGVLTSFGFQGLFPAPHNPLTPLQYWPWGTISAHFDCSSKPQLTRE